MHITLGYANSDSSAKFSALSEVAWAGRMASHRSRSSCLLGWLKSGKVEGDLEHFYLLAFQNGGDRFYKSASQPLVEGSPHPAIILSRGLLRLGLRARK